MSQTDLLSTGRLLPVMESFYSLQGEGFHTGEAAWFIRIGGCDVGCAWCDIKESWNADLFPPVETDQVVEKALLCPATAVIVTGGEPLLYNLDYLCEQLKSHDARGMRHKVWSRGHRAQSKALRGHIIQHPASSIQDPGYDIRHPASGIRTFLETSGSQTLSGSWDWICLSPKQAWPPRKEFYSFSHEMKVIIQDEEDFEWAEEQAGRMKYNAHFFLQPEWSRRDEMLPQIIRYIERHPAWRLSLQVHKYIGIP